MSNNTTSNAMSNGIICDSENNERIRPATADEARESLEAGEEGHILVDGRRVYVEDPCIGTIRVEDADV